MFTITRISLCIYICQDYTSAARECQPTKQCETIYGPSNYTSMNSLENEVVIEEYSVLRKFS